MTTVFSEKAIVNGDWFEEFLFNSENYRKSINREEPDTFKQDRTKLWMSLALTFMQIAKMLENNIEQPRLFMMVCGMFRLFDNFTYGDQPSQSELSHYYNFRHVFLNYMSRSDKTRDMSFEERVVLALYAWDMGELQKQLNQ